MLSFVQNRKMSQISVYPSPYEEKELCKAVVNFRETREQNKRCYCRIFRHQVANYLNENLKRIRLSTTRMWAARTFYRMCLFLQLQSLSGQMIKKVAAKISRLKIQPFFFSIFGFSEAWKFHEKIEKILIF